jgi:hypothetical protein
LCFFFWSFFASGLLFTLLANEAKDLFPERYVKAIADNQFEPSLNLFSELLRNVEDRLEVR